jgi:predicted nucleotidyltransferase
LTATKTIGKSRIHKPRIDDEYKQKLLSFLLADEANNFKRWKDEFKELFKKGRIVMIYGSAIKNYKAASDIDIMVVIKKGEVDEVNKIINKINMILPKEVHCIKLTEKDLLENIKEKNEAISDIIKNAIVLHGYDRYVEVIKNVASF